MFFFKEKPIVFDCFTFNRQAYEWAPIKETRHFIPTWWKETQAEYPAGHVQNAPASTIKRCEGFIELYKRGFMLPLWSDLAITIGSLQRPELSYVFASQEQSMRDHPAWQRGQYLPEPNYAHGKIISPWAIRTKELVPCLIFQPTWNVHSPDMFIVPPAVVEYKYQAATNINFFVTAINIKRAFNIPFNTPLMQIVPQTQRKFELKLHLVSEDEFNKVQNPIITFTRNYRTVRAEKERREKEGGK